MTDPTDTEPNPERATRLYLYGAVPAAIGTIATIIHLRAPIVTPELHSPLVNATLACWLLAALCAVADHICAKFDRRHDELLGLAHAHNEASSRDFRAAMSKLHKVCKRLESIERQNKEQAEEIEHLRSLLVEGRPLTGPSPYS